MGQYNGKRTIIKPPARIPSTVGLVPYNVIHEGEIAPMLSREREQEHLTIGVLEPMRKTHFNRHPHGAILCASRRRDHRAKPRP